METTQPDGEEYNGGKAFSTLPGFDVSGSILLTATASSQDRGDKGEVRGQNAAAGFMSRTSLRRAVTGKRSVQTAEDIPVERDYF